MLGTYRRERDRAKVARGSSSKVVTYHSTREYDMGHLRHEGKCKRGEIRMRSRRETREIIEKESTEKTGRPGRYIY
jgi:hypothetical protein